MSPATSPTAQLAQNNGGSGNAVTMGRYLDQYLPPDDHTIGTTNADLQWVRDTLDLMPNEAGVPAALEQLTGEVYVPLGTVALQRQFTAYNRFAARLRDSLFQTANLDQLADPPKQSAQGGAEHSDTIVRGQMGECSNWQSADPGMGVGIWLWRLDLR